MEPIIDGTFVRVGNGQARYPFPVCTICSNGASNVCYLNAKAKRALGNLGNVSWYKSKDENWVICLPTDGFPAYAPLTHKPGGFFGYVFPTQFMNGLVKPGTYKLFKYKGGFAFHPYDELRRKA